MGRAAKIGIVLWLLFAGVLLVQITRQTRDRIDLDTLRHVVREEFREEIREMTTTVNWQDANGKKKATQVPTVRQPEESTTDLAKRHLQDIADFEAEVVAQGGTIL